MNGFLVTFEGGEGCGKSTQIKKLSQFLEQEKIPFIVSREPGGTEVGEKIRDILLNMKAEMSSTVEFLLFSASRADHIEKVVKPALESGKIVLLDRFYDSSFVYQGYAGDLNLKDIQNVTELAVKDIKPNLTFLLDLDYEVGMLRKSKDDKLRNLDRIEQKGESYHKKVRNGYLKLAEQNPDRIVVIDASKTPDEIFEKIKAKILKYLNI